MEGSGYYYLHSNGDLIYKNSIVIESDPQYFDSPFVKRYWEMNFSDRSHAWIVILESLALGADLKRVKELAGKWGLTYKDSLEMLKRMEPNDLMKKGMDSFIENIIEMDVNEYWEEVKTQF